jgi:hypothetical protein
VRGARRRTTTPAEADQRPADLVQRDFTAPAPNPWGAEIRALPVSWRFGAA